MLFEPRVLTYVVHNEVGDEFYEGTDRAAAAAARDQAKAECAQECGTDGKESSPGRGDFACGVTSEHGIHIDILDEDGNNVSADPSIPAL